MSELISTEDALALVSRERLRVQVGDIFCQASQQNFYRVQALTVHEEGHLLVHFEYWDKYGKPPAWKKSSESPRKWENFSGYVRLDCTIEEAYEAGKEYMESGKMPDFNVPEEEQEQTNAVMGVNNKSALMAKEEIMLAAEEKMRAVQAKMNLYMEKKKNEMQQMIWGLDKQMKELKRQITKIRRVITAIELYLGIDEEITQIQEGEPAPEDYPIYFRQMLLYMDEEVAIIDNQGIDINDVDKFDEWLLRPGNLDACLPEKKGMVVFRYRRFNKEYGDKHVNAAMQYWNSRTFILLRNGDNVYRIFTENINIYPRLFPKREEFAELLRTIESMEKGEKHYWDQDRDKVEAQKASYMAYALFMQGIIDRTEVFKPMPERIDLFNLDAHPGRVIFIYDEEDGLGDGRMRFSEWKKHVNSQIGEGSRIVTAAPQYWTEGYSGRKEFADHFLRYYNDYNVPALPPSDIYTVEKISLEQVGDYRGKHFAEEDGKILTFLYNPKDEVQFGSNWDWDPHERKNRLRFMFDRDEIWVLNYDQISLEEVDFYLRCRFDRPNYLRMMPLLHAVKKLRLEEAKWEKDFVTLTAGRLLPKFPKTDFKVIEQIVWDCVTWWKIDRVKWKRPIRQDDTKALRMIEQKVETMLTNYEKTNSGTVSKKSL